MKSDVGRSNLTARRAYVGCATTAGPLVAPDRPDQPVRFRRVAARWEHAVLTLLILLNAATAAVFILWLLRPEHIPGWNGGLDGPALWLARFGFGLVIVVELIRLGQNVAVWVFAMNAKDPVPMDPPVGLRVALLTTIVPSKEPIEIVERTLRKMQQIVYCGSVDVWILDEGDDPAVKAMAARLGVHHFSRKGRPEYNQPEGEFRARSKAGNHNSWRAEHEHRYDVVAQMDPDHVPLPCFLERTIGFFRDPDVAFVVAPQVYGNMYENWVAHGASVQQYLFSGVVERGGNGLDAPLLIGTNHLYRPAAWRQIGGYQDSIIEDHLTSMVVQSSTNEATGNRWKGVYTPDVLAVGEGPTSWADYFNQQKRWAYGIWEILLTGKRQVRAGLTFRQRLLYGCVQFYYPSVATGLLLGNLATAFYLLFGVASIELDGGTWLTLWGASLGSWFLMWFWLRRFNLAEHERVEVGMPGMALALFAGPVYVAAGIAALLRRPLTYAVTAKGKLRTAESLGTFRLHLVWAALAAALLAVSFVFDHDYTALRFWSVLTLFTGIAPPIIALTSALTARAEARPAAATVRGTARALTGPLAADWQVYYDDAGHHEWHGRESMVWQDGYTVPADGHRRRPERSAPVAGPRWPANPRNRVPRQVNRADQRTEVLRRVDPDAPTDVLPRVRGPVDGPTEAQPPVRRPVDGPTEAQPPVRRPVDGPTEFLPPARRSAGPDAETEFLTPIDRLRSRGPRHRAEETCGDR
ncbi:glycosyltransferase family 2 protein [Micromonospora siamensis]|uniref:Glycosyltransferase, catalytic subunit of cellulose synthase and poly-beta-1,6-N-acetylglucosamine synthase n=1 Tax=Micromonospora siamensis TaxID=299152 RepID=A0A1C5GLG9_9ACTN|nr:glycosyltransferase family 2 protein [Micromonospora siamensis]SCG34658.1 Glycosyltransferase, catalytic subunit of cellulose synthase and poly-beta-1,6-N-acetylglucosamine synthase [Micromonospora siamensis]